MFFIGIHYVVIHVLAINNVKPSFMMKIGISMFNSGMLDNV